jgi:hypothetical protein
MDSYWVAMETPPGAVKAKELAVKPWIFNLEEWKFTSGTRQKELFFSTHALEDKPVPDLHT